MLARLSNEMVRAQKRYFGKGPDRAKSYIFDDLLLIVMRGGQTTAEKTMLDFDQQDKVRDFRQTFENEMTERLTDMVEEITGRKVLGYQSQIIFEPDVVVELFILDDRGSPDARTATGVGQLEDEPVGEATDQDALDVPTDSGQ
jgi:uncharacterized protein YbcI